MGCFQTYRLVAAGRRQSGPPHPESHTKTCLCPPLQTHREHEKDQRGLEANIKKDQSAAESPDCVSGCDDGGRGRGVPALKLQSGGCWVILSFTQALVRVSRSGGTISRSVNTESTTERRLNCHSHAPLSSHFCRSTRSVDASVKVSQTRADR